MNRPGYERLWHWFGLSYASWLTLPRVMMHEMPDDWQNRMAELLEEWDQTWDSSDMPTPSVSARKGNKFCQWPSWLLCYRHPDREEIEKLRVRDRANTPRNETDRTMKKASIEVDGYKCEVTEEDSLGGWTETYYSVIAPDGEEITSDHTSGPFEDGISACLVVIEDHKSQGLPI